ncbi:hypothetical protein [Amycolatopsis sp. NPDC098790]|uniref:hypothetical protein n=1 Tax=Amycolatopsis sp. NPDC098790 TaxID=3363939 RepID=UPI00380AB533
MNLPKGDARPKNGQAKPPRRRRKREETKMLFLDAAAALAIDRIGSEGDEPYNLLASVRIADVLEEINSRPGETTDIAPMTTGAIYHIWPDQAAFQIELLEHVMNKISTPGASMIERKAFEMVADGAPPEDIFRMVSDADFEATSSSPELFLALGLGALAPAQLVREAQESANSAYLASTEHLLSTLLRYAKRRVVPGRTIQDLIWATEALTVGYLLRWRTHPEIPVATDDEGSSARASAYLGIVYAFTEPITPPKP